MNLFSKYANAVTRLLMTFAIMLSITSCVTESDNCPEPAKGNGTVNLRFTIVTRSHMDNGTRQSRAADVTGDLEGTAAENYLDLSGHDISFLLFDENQRLLRNFTPDVDVSYVPNTNYVKYTVRATIAEPYLEKVSTQNTDFFIMVLANGRPYSLNAFILSPGVTTISDVMGQLVAFDLPVVTSTGEGWEPSAPGTSNGQYIPMAGLQKFTLVKGAFDNAGPESFINLSPDGGAKDINMLRALSKIEVIDRIDLEGTYNPNVVRNTYIEKVELLGYNAMGTILPTFNQWNRNDVLETQQVQSPTLPENPQYKIPLSSDAFQNTATGTNINFHADAGAQGLRTDNSPVFSVYPSEYSRSGIADNPRPYVRITLRTGSQSELYLMKLAEYSIGQPVQDTDLTSLLRNHIYRYEVRKRSDQELVVTVCPRAEFTTDVPTFE